MLITFALASLMTPTLEASALASIPACSGEELASEDVNSEDLAYEALFSQYEEEYDAWREDLRASKGLKERRELRKLEPAVLFGPRFKALADSGSGRSLLWLLDNARKVAERKELPDRKLEWYGRLFSSHLDADWFGDAIEKFTKERRDVSAEHIEATLADALERAKGDAHARVLLGLARYRLAGKCNSGLEFYEQLIEEHPKSSLAKVAQSEYDRLTKFGMGAAPPDFKGETIDGEEISLYANRGKVTVIDFWGYWWGPCRGEIPHLNALVKRHKNDPFALVAVNCHDNQEEFLEGQGEIKTDYTSIFGGAPIAEAWGVNGFPTMFVLDETGKIRFKDVRGEALDDAVKQLLDEQREKTAE